MSLARLDLDALHRRFFFETDLLCQLALSGGPVEDVPMQSRYGAEISNLRARDVLLSFPPRIGTCLLRRH